MSVLDSGAAYTKARLGLRVDKTATAYADGDLFTVVGQVLITLLYGVVTVAADATATTILLNEKASSLNLCAATTVTSDAIGEVYRITGDAAVIMNGTANVPRLKIASLLSAFQSDAIIFDGQAGLIIEQTITGAQATLAVAWHLFYVPLSDGAYVAAA